MFFLATLCSLNQLSGRVIPEFCVSEGTVQNDYKVQEMKIYVANEINAVR
jgi:hypothetical protein